MANEELSQVLRDYMQVAERLQDTHRALESEVQHLRRELKQKDRELQQRRRLAALGELAAGVAHEVRNPLGAIELYSGLLKRECTQIQPALELIQKIQAGIRSIDSVVQSTLALAPNRMCRIQTHALQTVVERAVEMSAEVYRRQGTVLELDMPPGEVKVDCDSDALQRVILNLLANAAEASPRGGRVRLEFDAAIETDMGDRSAPAPSGAQIQIRVSDSGGGLPDDLSDRVFDPFFTTKGNGTGLGLSIAYRLVEAHGGRLTAHNRPEGGAEFVVTLAQHQPPERGPQADPTDGAPASAPARGRAASRSSAA